MTGYQSKKAAAQAIDEINWADHEPDGLEQPEQEPVAFLVDGDLYYPEEIDWETLQEQGHTVASLYTSPPQPAHRAKLLPSLR